MYFAAFTFVRKQWSYKQHVDANLSGQSPSLLISETSYTSLC